MSEELPYKPIFEEADKLGRVFGREGFYGSGPPLDIVHEELLEFIIKVSGPRVLDIGCGLGPNVAELNRRGFDCTGVEIKPELAREAGARGRSVFVRMVTPSPCVMRSSTRASLSK